MPTSLNFDEYYPLDHGFGSPANSARWQKMASVFVPDGVVVGRNNQLNATIAGAGPYNVTFQSGAVWSHGIYGENFNNYVISPVNANGLIVARLDFSLTTVYLNYIDGAGAVPVTNVSTFWDVPLWKIVAGALVDQRPFVAANAFPTSVRVGPLTIWTGNGAPANTLGANNDFYLRGDGTEAGHTIMYHKEGGVWIATAA